MEQLLTYFGCGFLSSARTEYSMNYSPVAQSLLRAVKALHTKYETDSGKLGLFEDLETLGAELTPCREEFEKCLEELSRRLRRDTEAVLHLKVRKFAELFDPNNTRISFQNRVLVYLLYKCGGFFPSSLEIPELQREYAISRDRTICRHGTLRDEQLKQFLSPPLFDVMKGGFSSVGAQTDQIKWSGGFFDYPGPSTLRRRGRRFKEGELAQRVPTRPDGSFGRNALRFDRRKSLRQAFRKRAIASNST